MRLSPLLLLLTLLSLLAPVPAAARECATLELLAAAREGQLPLAMAALQMRPPSVGSIASERYPIRVHWPSAELAGRAPLVLEIAEDAWRRQIEEMGYDPPLSDQGEGGDERFDVYLGLVAPAGALTIAHDDVDPEDGRHASSAHIVIEASLSDEELAPYLHHEFAHACHFAMDRSESLMFFEASAVAQEYFLDRSLGFPTLSWAEDLEDFQALPNAPVFSNGVDLRRIVGRELLYEYGAALFLLYLEQEHGEGDGTLIRQLWEGSVQPDDVDENEPDWLDVLEGELGLSAADLILDFATWRALVAGWAVSDDHLEGADLLSGDALLKTRRLLPDTLERGAPLLLGESNQPYPLGCLAVETSATLTKGIPLKVQAQAHAGKGGERRPLGMAWLVGHPEEGVVRRGWHGGRGEALVLRMEIPPAHTGMAFVCDIGSADADEMPMGTDVTVRVRRTDVELPEAGPAPDDAGQGDGLSPEPVEAPPACSCQGARGSGKPLALAVLSFFWLALFFARGLKAWRRRRLYRTPGRRDADR